MTATTDSRTRQFLRRYDRPFVRNAWYCAGWAEEITDNLVARRILDEPVVLYRTEEGEAVALSDICPHKLAPMHLGVRVGSNLRCGYHGLEFDASGQCVLNPQGNRNIPARARLKSYPLRERHQALWIWMGDAETADDSLIPDFQHLSDPRQRAVKGGHHVKCNYMIMVENLMDLGHALFLHGQTAGLQPYDVEGVTVSDTPTGGVLDQRTYRDVKPPTAFAPHMPKGQETFDFWTDIRWEKPTAILNWTGSAPTQHVRTDQGVFLLGSHFLTPETQHTTHYFYAHNRNYALDDPAADDFWRTWQKNALHREDSMMGEAIDTYLADAEALGIEMTLLSTDVSGARVNQAIDRLVEAERA